MDVREWNTMLGYGSVDRLSNVRTNEELQDVVNRYSQFQQLQNHQKAHNDVTNQLNEALHGFTGDTSQKLIARVQHETPYQVDDRSIFNNSEFIQQLTVFYKQSAWPEAWPEDPRALYPLVTAVTALSAKNANLETGIQLLTKVYCDTFGVENFLRFCGDHGPFTRGILAGVLMHYAPEQKDIEPVYKKLAEIAKENTPATMLPAAIQYLYDQFEPSVVAPDLGL